MVKQRIIEEASELFGRSGVKSITMDDLARHLGISKRTIYENFKDKETLLIACIDDLHFKWQAFYKKAFVEAINVAEAILALLQNDAEQRQSNMIEDIRKYYPQVYKEHLSKYHTDKSREFSQMIIRGVNEGVFRENLNSDVIVLFFSKLIEDTSYVDNFTNRFTLKEVQENLAITFLRGMCTPKGLEIIDKYINEKTDHY